MAYQKIKTLLPPRIQHHLSTVKRYRSTPIEALTARYAVHAVTEERYLDDAKKLHASVYLAHGFVKKKDVSAGGYLTKRADPHVSHADYFVAVDSKTDEVVALVRQIHQRSGHRIPVIAHALSRKDYRHTHKEDIVEVSAFAKKPGVDSRVTILLFAEMLRHSRQNGHSYWVFACDSQVYRRLKTLFGGLLHRTGPEVFYMGSNVVPAEVNVDQALHRLYRNYRYSVPPLRQVRKFLYNSLRSLSDQPQVRLSRTAFWDQYARAYDGLLHLAPYRHLVDHVSDLALASQPRHVLDLGCGTGNVTTKLLGKDKSVQVDAVDWSGGMLDALRRKTHDQRVSIRQSDAMRYLATTRRRYDVIVLNNVVYTMNDRPEFWRLVHKCLNAGGRVIVAHPDTANSGALLQDHVSQQSFMSLLRPRLIMIGLFDAAISFLGMSRRYAFTPANALVDEAGASGLRLDGEIGRCYGGHVNGIDVLFALKKL